MKQDLWVNCRVEGVPEVDKDLWVNCRVEGVPEVDKDLRVNCRVEGVSEFDKDLRVETSCFIFLIIATRVTRKRFCCSFRT